MELIHQDTPLAQGAPLPALSSNSPDLLNHRARLSASAASAIAVAVPVQTGLRSRPFLGFSVGRTAPAPRRATPPSTAPPPPPRLTPLSFLVRSGAWEYIAEQEGASGRCGPPFRLIIAC
jgi:hypothetical protein